MDQIPGPDFTCVLFIGCVKRVLEGGVIVNLYGLELKREYYATISQVTAGAIGGLWDRLTLGWA